MSSTSSGLLGVIKTNWRRKTQKELKMFGLRREVITGVS